MEIINRDENDLNKQVGGNWACFMGCTAGCIIMPTVNAVASVTALL